MKFILPHVYRAVALRETCKSMIIKKSHEMRLAYRKLAKNFVWMADFRIRAWYFTCLILKLDNLSRQEIQHWFKSKFSILKTYTKSTLEQGPLSRYRHRFFDQIGHQSIYASIGNKHFFTKWCHCQTYQNYEQSRQKLGTFLGDKVL